MTSHQTDSTGIQVALIGDSDISRWPSKLMPSPPPNSSLSVPVVNGRSGATLEEMIPLIATTAEEMTSQQSAPDTPSHLILVLCAGENDVGQGYSLDRTMSSFEKVIDACFTVQLNQSFKKVNVVFLGPKLEPWLIDDPSSCKQYVKLSKGLRRAADRHDRSSSITYVDCLTLFCGQSARLLGAITSKAVAEKIYFHEDGLHLSDEGYKIWKTLVETEIANIIDTGRVDK